MKDVLTNGNLVKKIIRELALNVNLLIGISQDKIKLGRKMANKLYSIGYICFESHLLVDDLKPHYKRDGGYVGVSCTPSLLK